MAIKDRILKGLSVFKIPKKSVLKFLSIALIFVIAFIVRTFPVIKYGYGIRAYDPYVQFYTAKYIENNGLKAFLMLLDTQSWAPWGRKLGTFYIGVGGTGALLHSLLSTIGVNISLITVVALVPPLFGTLSCLVIYGLVGDLSSDRAALFSAFIAAISMGMIRRTIVGFFDNDAVGVFLILMSLWMFIRGMKKKSVVYPFFSGIFLALLTWTWGAHKYLFGLYVLFAFILLIARKMDVNSAMNYVITILVATGVMVILPANYGQLTEPVVLLSVGIIFLILLNFLAVYMTEFTSIQEKTAIRYLIGGSFTVAIIVGIFLYITGGIGGVGGKYLSILNPTIRSNLPAFSSVSENQPAPWSALFQGIFLPILFTPLGVYYFFEKRTKRGGFFVLCMITAFYFSSSISRLVVMFSPFFAMAGGIGIDFLLGPLTAVLKKEWITHKVRPVRRRLGELTLPRGEAVAGYALVGLILLLSIYHTNQNVQRSAGAYIESGEEEIFQYLRTHASSEDRVAAWWDYGYRLRYMAHVTTLVDNFTGNYKQIGAVGSMLMLPPTESVEIMRKYGVKYVVVYGGERQVTDIRKAQWMIKISSKHAPKWGVERDEWYDEETHKYKEPLFESTLWKLVAAQIRTDTNWVKNLGVQELKDQASNYEIDSPQNLKFFEEVETGGRVYLYKVLYRAPIDELPPIQGA